MDSSRPTEPGLSRREFVRNATIASAAASLGIGAQAGAAESSRPSALTATAPTRSRPEFPPGFKPMVGFQAEANYVLQYGVARFLDDLQARASVNTLMLHMSPFEASWTGLDRAKNAKGN